MRVVRSSVYRRYTSSLNDLQSNLNKSMNKVSTGAAYETAADNPLAYYQGKKELFEGLAIEQLERIG